MKLTQVLDGSVQADDGLAEHRGGAAEVLPAVGRVGGQHQVVQQLLPLPQRAQRPLLQPWHVTAGLHSQSARSS